MEYDYLIVGAGLFGSVFAYEMTKAGKKCLVIDKRKHVGGNCYTEKNKEIIVHKYGAHIFHTSDKWVWEYINKFCEFNNFVNSPIAIYNDEVYNLPFNMNTFNKMWGVTTPEQAKFLISKKTSCYNKCDNFEDKALSLVGREIYEKLIKGYTEKQWKKSCKELPLELINRIPLRFEYNNNYFNDKYQGVPIGGYTPIFDKLLKNIKVLLNTDFYTFIKTSEHSFRKILFCGSIDKFYNYQYGKLEYRELKFVEEFIELENYQGNAVVNYTSNNVDFTRIIEHKFFENTKCNYTIITKEYPVTFKNEPYYPVNTKLNNEIYNKYLKLSNGSNIIFAGRIGGYKYYNMDETIKEAISLVERELNYEIF